MDKRYTEHLNRVIEDANDIANAYDTGYIGTEHILFGLICEEKSAAGRLLKEMGADRTRYKEEFRRSIDRTTMVRGYTPRTKRLFATATEVALRGPVKTIPGTEHMLYAVLSMKDCLAVLILKRMGIDLLSASGHKIHGPKGVGFLYIGPNVKIRPILFGGEQQKNIRSGTENVPGIAGLALASKMIYRDLEMKTALMRELKGRFLEGIKKIDNTVVHGLTDEGSAPHIISVGIAGIRSEVLLHTLEEKGIYVSSGSACSSNHPSVSGVLKGIGAAREYLDATLRFSMSEFTTKEEIDYTLETLYNCVPTLRKYTRH